MATHEVGMTGPTTSVALSDSELLLLVRACTDKVQNQVDLARRRVDWAAAHPDVTATAVKVIVAAVADLPCFAPDEGLGFSLGEGPGWG